MTSLLVDLAKQNPEFRPFRRAFSGNRTIRVHQQFTSYAIRRCSYRKPVELGESGDQSIVCVRREGRESGNLLVDSVEPQSEEASSKRVGGLRSRNLTRFDLLENRGNAE